MRNSGLISITEILRASYLVIVVLVEDSHGIYRERRGRPRSMCVVARVP